MLVKQQTGFTLVELMVAMAVGSIIILGAGYLFLTTFQTFKKVEEISRKQETLVFSAFAIIDGVRGGDDGGSGYSIECAWAEDEQACKCDIDDVEKSQPILSFEKDVVEDQCASGPVDPSKSSDTYDYLYEVNFPFENDGEPITFHVANRDEVLKEYFQIEPETGYDEDGNKLYHPSCYRGKELDLNKPGCQEGKSSPGG